MIIIKRGESNRRRSTNPRDDAAVVPVGVSDRTQAHTGYRRERCGGDHRASSVQCNNIIQLITYIIYTVLCLQLPRTLAPF